jgi:hypothetical protein
MIIREKVTKIEYFDSVISGKETAKITCGDGDLVFFVDMKSLSSYPLGKYISLDIKRIPDVKPKKPKNKQRMG